MSTTDSQSLQLEQVQDLKSQIKLLLKKCSFQEA
jgi:hypothetical protein